MPTLLELCTTPEKMVDIKNELEEKERKLREKEIREMKENHRKSHIFDTYESALDWLITHPEKRIEWHCKTLKWDEERELFKLYEQDYGVDGIIPFDVVKYYTKEELLENIESGKKWFIEKYPEENGKAFWLDEFGKLDHVYVLN